MTRARIYIMYMLLAAVLCCGCDGEDWTRKGRYEVVLPVSICLPASEVYASQAPARRVFGDPGTNEQFGLPNYLYYFVVGHKNDLSGKVLVYLSRSVEDEASPADWEKKWTKKSYSGSLDYVGDSIYQYSEEISVALNSDMVFDGRVYAVASAVELDFSPDVTEGSTTEEALLGLTFRFDGTEKYDSIVRSNLQNIYSTPHNYTYNGKYYGSFSAERRIMHLNLLLYHVASKVDLMWNVAEAKRDSVKISYVAVEHMYNGPSFLFKPMENTVAAPVYASGYKMELLTSLSPGTQWNGRAYFYAIPYNNNDVDGESNPDPHYPLKLRLQKNGDPSDGSSYYSKTVQTEVPTVWTPWIRGQITINNGKYNVTTPTP